MISKIEEVVALMKQNGVTRDMLEAYAYFGLAQMPNFKLRINRVYPGECAVFDGQVIQGCLRVGMKVAVVEEPHRDLITIGKCLSIERQGNIVDSCSEGDFVVLKLETARANVIIGGMETISTDMLGYREYIFYEKNSF